MASFYCPLVRGAYREGILLSLGLGVANLSSSDDLDEEDLWRGGRYPEGGQREIPCKLSPSQPKICPPANQRYVPRPTNDMSPGQPKICPPTNQRYVL